MKAELNAPVTVKEDVQAHGILLVPHLGNGLGCVSCRARSLGPSHLDLVEISERHWLPQAPLITRLSPPGAGTAHGNRGHRRDARLTDCLLFFPFRFSLLIPATIYLNAEVFINHPVSILCFMTSRG